jgi:hypothetical protein
LPARPRWCDEMALLAVLALLMPATPAHAAAATFEGRRCTPPAGHRIADCRLARHGTPDLSRAAWRALRGREVTISVRFESLAPNPAAGGARAWPMLDSLGQPMGTLETGARGRIAVRGTDGRSYRVTSVRMRGRGGGTGCGPSGRERARLRPLADPRVDPAAHARLSSGAINDVKEYDAKPAFGDVVYFMSNTTQVKVGGITRGMVRVGTPVATIDGFRHCDPSSDGTLTWRYLSIRTGVPGRPRLYGWVPARCPARMRR